MYIENRSQNSKRPKHFLSKCKTWSLELFTLKTHSLRVGSANLAENITLLTLKALSPLCHHFNAADQIVPTIWGSLKVKTQKLIGKFLEWKNKICNSERLHSHLRKYLVALTNSRITMTLKLNCMNTIVKKYIIILNETPAMTQLMTHFITTSSKNMIVF